MKKYIFFILGLFFLWEYVSQSSLRLASCLPPPSQIFLVGIERFDRLLFHAYSTFLEMVYSIISALCISLLLVLCMMRSPSFASFIQAVFVVIKSLPTFALAPVMVLWFGWSKVTIIISATLTIMFPLTLVLYKGLQSTPKPLIDYFKVHGATKKELFWKLALPSSLPYFFSGIRIAFALSGIAVLSGEWVGAQEGLGVLIVKTRDALDIEMTFAALAMVMMLTMGFYCFGIFLEKNHKKFLQASIRWGLCGLLCFCTGCTESHHEEKVVVALDWFSNPNYVPLFVGKEKGFFSDEGLFIECIHNPKINPLQLLSTEKVALAVSHLPKVTRGVSRKMPFTVIGQIIDTPLNGFLVDQESGIYKLQDVHKKTLGCFAEHTSTGELLLQEHGIVPKEKVYLGFSLVQALIMGQVDAIYGVYKNIEMHQLQAFGVKGRFFSIQDLGMPSYSELVFVAKKGTVFSGEAFCEKFTRALFRSIHYCKKYPEKAFLLYAATQQDKGPKTVLWEKASWVDTVELLAEKQEFSKKDVAVLLDWLYQKGILSERISPEEVIHPLLLCQE